MKQPTTRAATLLIAAVAGLAYANALWNGFALDDTAIIQHNPRVHDLRALADIWLTPYWPSYGEQLGLYRPLAIFAYAVQWAVGSGAPWLFHAANLVLHALVSVLVYALTLKLLPTLGRASDEVLEPTQAQRLGALLGGLVFALHPVHTEAVANIVGQAELIAAATTLGACILHATRPAASLSARRLLAIAALFFVGMLAKESAIVLPALLVAIDAAQGRWRYDRTLASYARGMALPIVLLAGVAFAYLGLRIGVLGSIGGVHAAPNLPFLREEYRAFVALRAWPEYVRLLAWPPDLSSDYSPAVILPVEGITPMAGLGGLLLVATAGLALLTPLFPRAGLPAAWFFITILPVSNLLIPIGVVVAERLLYSPSVALSFVVAFAAERMAFAPARTRRMASFAAIAVLLLAGVQVVRRNPDWNTTDTVWDALVRDHPESYRAQLVNATRAMQAGQHGIAEQYVELAYRLWPYDAPMLHLLSQYAQEDGEFDRAISLLEQAESIAPFISTYPLARAVALMAAERPLEALPALERAGELGARPKFVGVVQAQAYERAGRPAEAAAMWGAALDAPGADLWTFWSLYARSLARTGARSDALAAADSADALAASTAERTYVQQLRDAIGRGCYDNDASSDSGSVGLPTTSCDPLAAWGLVVPMELPNATTLQNASAQAADSVRAGSGG